MATQLLNRLTHINRRFTINTVIHECVFIIAEIGPFVDVLRVTDDLLRRGVARKQIIILAQEFNSSHVSYAYRNSLNMIHPSADEIRNYDLCLINEIKIVFAQAITLYENVNLIKNKRIIVTSSIYDPNIAAIFGRLIANRPLSVLFTFTIANEQVAINGQASQGQVSQGQITQSDEYCDIATMAAVCGNAVLSRGMLPTVSQSGHNFQQMWIHVKRDNIAEAHAEQLIASIGQQMKPWMRDNVTRWKISGEESVDEYMSD